MEIPHGSKDHVIVPNTIKITFHLDFESLDIARSINSIIKEEITNAWIIAS